MIELTWATVGGIAPLVIALIAIARFWNAFANRMSDCENSARAASILSAALQVKADSVQKELSDFKTQAARDFVSHNDLSQTETRFLDLVNQIRADIRGVTERLDSVLANK